MITILAIGKKHEDWVRVGIERFEARLKQPFDVSWTLLPHSSLEGDAARKEESERLSSRLSMDSYVILLDERGLQVDSPKFAAQLEGRFTHSPVTIIIGGAYGVTEELAEQADLKLSLSAMVFPHQLVRLLIVEQIYRAQMISLGSNYHHV